MIQQFLGPQLGKTVLRAEVIGPSPPTVKLLTLPLSFGICCTGQDALVLVGDFCVVISAAP